MRAFVRVVERGSFAGAARSLELSPAMVTKHVAYLEERLGTRLLNRTTRSVRPTDAGQNYYQRCVELLAAIEEAENSAAAGQSEPRGTLRVTAPVEFGNMHLAGYAVEFMEDCPKVELVLDFTNRVVNIVEEGYDLAIRIAASLDTGMIGRKLATSRFHVVASPKYLKRQGRPKTPQSLVEHSCLCFALPAPRTEWPFYGRDGKATVRVKSRMMATSSEALRLAALAGAGVSWLPSFVCGEDLKRGRLVSLFSEYDTGSLEVFAIYPHRQFLPAKVRTFIDFLVKRMGGDARRDPWGPISRSS